MCTLEVQLDFKDNFDTIDEKVTFIFCTAQNSNCTCAVLAVILVEFYKNR